MGVEWPSVRAQRLAAEHCPCCQIPKLADHQLCPKCWSRVPWTMRRELVLQRGDGRAAALRLAVEHLGSMNEIRDSERGTMSGIDPRFVFKYDQWRGAVHDRLAAAGPDKVEAALDAAVRLSEDSSNLVNRPIGAAAIVGIASVALPEHTGEGYA